MIHVGKAQTRWWNHLNCTQNLVSWNPTRENRHARSPVISSDLPGPVVDPERNSQRVQPAGAQRAAQNWKSWRTVMRQVQITVACFLKMPENWAAAGHAKSLKMRWKTFCEYKTVIQSSALMSCECSHSPLQDEVAIQWADFNVTDTCRGQRGRHRSKTLTIHTLNSRIF